MSRGGLALLATLGACTGGPDAPVAACGRARGCAVNADCPAGEVCGDGGCCVAAAICTAGSCPAGEFCSDEASCLPVITLCESSACECHIVGGGGEIEVGGDPEIALVPGASRTIDVTLSRPGGAPLPGGTRFELALDAGTPFAVAGDTITALPTPDRSTATLTARAGTVSCSAQLVNLGTAPEAGRLRFFVYDNRTGRGVPGALLHVDYDHDGDHDAGAQPLLSDSSGVALTPDAPTGPTYAVTAFAPGYNYVSFAGIAARDVAVPITPQPVPAVTGGFSGKLDLETYERVVLDSRSRAITLGAVGASFSIDSLLNFSADLFIGSITDQDCDLVPLPAGCYSIDIPGLRPTNAPLPGGLVINLAETEIKPHFDVVAAAGRRVAWSFSGQFDAAELTELFDVLVPMFDCRDCAFSIGAALAASLPLLPRFALGTRGNLALAATPLADWNAAVAVPYGDRPPDGRFPRLDDGALGRLELTEPLSQLVDVTVPPLPPDPAIDAAMEGMLVITGVELPGFGFVPMGAGTALDCTVGDCLDRAGNAASFDGVVNGAALCGPEVPRQPVCPAGMPQRLPDGHIALFTARPTRELEGQPQLTLVAALPLSSLTQPGALPRASAVLVRQPARLAVSQIAAADFVDAPPMPASLTGRSYAVGFAGAANIDMHAVTFRDDAAGGDLARRWHVFFPAGNVSFTAPPVPSGWEDPLGATPVRVSHIAFDLEAGASFESLARHDSDTLTDLPQRLRAVSFHARQLDRQ